MADDASNQRLLGREVVVQRGDVDADVSGDVAGAQALEAVGGDAPIGGDDQGAAAISLRLGGCAAATFRGSYTSIT